MKILILMPLDEKWTYAATGIYKNLPEEIKNKTFAMPMFMQYLMSTKASPNWTYAVFDALISAESLCKTADAAEDDLIVIGNVSNKYEFDVIFNFQDIHKDLPYEDLFIEKIKEIVKGSSILEDRIAVLHKADESKMALHNCEATAQFITDYMKSDVSKELKQIKEEYLNKLEKLGATDDYYAEA